MEDESLKWFTKSVTEESQKTVNKLKVQRSEEERTEDAQAFGDEEGRGKLRKAPGNRKQVQIRGCPNGETRMAEGHAHLE